MTNIAITARHMSIRAILMRNARAAHWRGCEMKLYMYTTLDEYELPVAVADTKKELARMLRRSVNSVQSCFSHKNRGYITVEIDDDE